ncbi:MAG: CTP synthase, partial [Pseudomonadota bacterium]
KIKNPKTEVTIGIVGKYVELRESYKSLNEALAHGGVANEAKVNLAFLDAESVNQECVHEITAELDGILVPGGFGARGIEGKIEAARCARENKIPYFGLCLGMQAAVVEFARHVAGLEGAHSSEFDSNSPYPVIYLMKEWFDYQTKRIEHRDESSDLGGTMRLGAYPCHLSPESKAFEAYGRPEISERHRHRYEFNNEFRQVLAEKGLVFSGVSPDGQLVEIIELLDHPWFLGCQFHPEFKSRPMDPHPLFREFIRAALEYRERRIPG